MSSRLSYEAKEGVARIILNDGKVNVMSIDMMHEIGAALDRAEADAEILMLRSSRPGIFSAGFDLKVFASGDVGKSLEMVKTGAELAMRLMLFPLFTVGALEGHAFPMGTFLLLACDVRLGARGPHRMGLNEVNIGISPPGFAIELARSRLHPAWLSRTVTLGEMYQPDEAQAAGFLDRVVSAELMDEALAETAAALRQLHRPSHATAKMRLRRSAIDAMRAAIESELTISAYEASSRERTAVLLPGG
jgi:enoyl-CoA hydratase